MNKNMVYGANEATSLTDKVADFTKGKNIHFGSGAFEEQKVVAIATAAESDAKVRFVYDATGDSGMVFVGNQLASSKILDITTNKVAKKHFNPETGNYVESTTEKVATKVTVTWFGSQEDPADNVVKTKVWETVFDVIDTDTVKAMIDKASADLNKSVDDLKTKHEADVLRLDTSVNGIETLLKSDVVSADTGSALTVTPTSADATGYKTYKVAVNVDDAEGSTIKVVDNKIKIAKYAIKQVAADSMEKDADTNETKYASEYQLMMTDADGVTKAVGDKINIAKDFLVTKAHVCTFKYAKVETTTNPDTHEVTVTNKVEIVYGTASDQWGQTSTVNYGDEVKSEAMLPYSINQDGTVEQARLGFGIKYGHSYLHLVINTKPTNTKAARLDDVYLDFTEIFTTFKGDDKFITVQNGVVSLNIDAVSTAVDTKLKINETFTELKAKDTEIEGRLDGLDTSVSAIEDSYVKDASLEAPKADNEQFNTLKITNSKDGAESVVTVDVANEKYYAGLNTALNTLTENDKHLSALLTWEEL